MLDLQCGDDQHVETRADKCCPFCVDDEPCTFDAQICPDGSSVGRDPKNHCEFSPCPNPCDANPCPAYAPLCVVDWTTGNYSCSRLNCAAVDCAKVSEVSALTHTTFRSRLTRELMPRFDRDETPQKMEESEVCLCAVRRWVPHRVRELLPSVRFGQPRPMRSKPLLEPHPLLRRFAQVVHHRALPTIRMQRD